MVLQFSFPVGLRCAALCREQNVLGSLLFHCLFPKAGQQIYLAALKNVVTFLSIDIRSVVYFVTYADFQVVWLRHSVALSINTADNFLLKCIVEPS